MCLPAFHNLWLHFEKHTCRYLPMTINRELPLTRQACVLWCRWWQFFRKQHTKQRTDTGLPSVLPIQTRCQPYSCETLKHITVHDELKAKRDVVWGTQTSSQLLFWGLSSLGPCSPCFASWWGSAGSSESLKPRALVSCWPRKVALVLLTSVTGTHSATLLEILARFPLSWLIT